VRPRRIALGVPPKSGERECESGWWLVCGEGVTEIVQGQCKFSCWMLAVRQN